MGNRLGELRKSLADMDQDEKLALIRRIRADRRLTKERPAAKRAVARSKDKDKTQLGKLLDGLSAEEITALLGGMEDDAGKGSTTS